MTHDRGRFIVFEGGDGAGKTTQLNLTADFLNAEGIAYIQTREPGGCPLAEELRALILRGNNTPQVELMLLMTARAAHISEVIAPALASGKWVLCDRFLDSTLAYQGAGLGLDQQYILDLHQKLSAGISVDLTVLLDIELHEAKSRYQHARDGIEARSDAFQQRVYQCFRTLAQKDTERHMILDSSESMSSIQIKIAQKLRELYNECAS